MFTMTVAYLTALATPTQGQLAVDTGRAPIVLENPPTLVLALIGIGTLAVYGILRRTRGDDRGVRGESIGTAASVAAEQTSAATAQPAEAERAA